MGLVRWSAAGLALSVVAAMGAATGQDAAMAQGQGQPPPVAGPPPPLSALPSLLQLQPDQRDAWRTYTDAIAQDRSTHQNPSDLAQRLNLMQTPERLDAMVDQMKADQTAFQRRAAATKAFYAVLTPDQKETFDTITRLPTSPQPTQRPLSSSPYRPPQSTLPQPPSPQVLPPPRGSAPQ